MKLKPIQGAVNIPFSRQRYETSDAPAKDIVIAYLKDNADAGVRLAGHTDNSGAERYNVDLSLNRCLSAKAYLLDKGIADSRIKLFHYGETRPAATNATSVGRQLNRRVDITLFAN